jgi:carbonic anhydrase
MINTDIIDNSISQTLESQSAITPEAALELLKEGNSRFLNNKPLSRDYANQVIQTAQGQYPLAIILSCIDSRVTTELIFDQGIGDIFNACVAGNFVNPDILGSMEFACKFAGVKLVVVLGHTSCGAVKGACDSVETGNLKQLLDKIKPAVTATHSANNEDRSSGNLNFVNRVAVKNVAFTISDIHKQSAVLSELSERGEISIVPAMYDVATGKVKFLN